jgi:hypothetical protein
MKVNWLQQRQQNHLQIGEVDDEKGDYSSLFILNSILKGAQAAMEHE